MKKHIKILLTAFTCLFMACSNANKNPIIKFSADYSHIRITNIQKSALLYLKNNAVTNQLLEVRLADASEKVLSGKIIIKTDEICFYPESPFQTKKTYLVRSYIGSRPPTFIGLFKKNAQLKALPTEQLLKR